MATGTAWGNELDRLQQSVSFVFRRRCTLPARRRFRPGAPRAAQREFADHCAAARESWSQDGRSKHGR